MESVFRVFCLISLMALGACSTITKGQDQTLTIITDPAGATCSLTRRGTTVGAASRTPASIVLEKSKDDVSVLCEKEDHFDGAATLASSFEGMTFGNIILGGIIGIAVDAASGAMHRFPSSITIFLTPKRFESTAARNRYFERRKARVEADAADTVKKVLKNCNRDEEDCDALVKAINGRKDAQLRELDAQRETARIERN